MASSEWNEKAAAISAAAAWKEYGISHDFIMYGIQTGKLDHKAGTIKGKPYIRVLRSQLERLIAEEPGGFAHLSSLKAKAELREVNKEIAYLNKKLAALLTRRAGIEAYKVGLS